MVISRHINGKFRTLRYGAESILLAIFFALPWFQIGETPLIRFDIPARKYYLFGNIYIPQEMYYLHMLLLFLGLCLFFFTSLIGRVWCGWSCPQTVFTDLFDLFGRLILRKKYGKKDASSISKSFLYLVWILLSLISGLHITGYFVDIREMIAVIVKGGAEFTKSTWPYFWGVFSLALFFDMGFMREQFCRYVCPYARFQAVLMDEHSINVTYNHKRGEPRRNKTEKIGDCTACNMCIVVCPTGIDIRDGLQIGCIACAKCVDACTKQMGKENKLSLISYTSQAKVEGNSAWKWLRTRTVIYGLLLSLVISIFIFIHSGRVPMYVSVLPHREIHPAFISDDTVHNYYYVSTQNMTYSQQELSIVAESSDLQAPIKLRIGENEPSISVPKNSRSKTFIILEVAGLKKKDQREVRTVNLIVTDKNDNSISRTTKVPFIIPTGKKDGL